MREAVLRNVSNDRMLDYLFQQCPYEQFEALRRSERRSAQSTNIVKRLVNWIVGEKQVKQDPYPEYYTQE